MGIKIIFNKSAFKHRVTENDIRCALSTFLVDIAINENTDGYDKFLIIGFDTKGVLIELIYNLIDENNINVFHAMKCRKEYLKLLER